MISHDFVEQTNRVYVRYLLGLKKSKYIKTCINS